jgi:DNA invertase Pin-like site-specific DNA recombinase
MPSSTKHAPGSRAILYARVSTEEQAGEDHYSISAQLNEMKEFAERKGWKIAGEFIDEGISGTRRDRPQLQAALETIAQHSCDVFLVHELSRLSRSVYHTLDLFDYFGKNGVGFASVRDPDFDFADPTKRLFLTILAAINEYYIVLLRQHTSKSKRQRVKEGLYNASITPFGYRLSGDPKKPAVIDEQEAKVIVLAFELYATGRYSDMELAEVLTRRGYRTRSKRNFSKDTISGILTNEFYRGKVTHSHVEDKTRTTEIYQGLHPAIISDELWEKCQALRNEKRMTGRATQSKFRVYLLSHLAVCDVCGRKLRAQGNDKVSYYREMSRERGFSDCPNQSGGIRADIVDKQIDVLMQVINLPQDWLEEVAKKVGDDNEVIQLKRQRESFESELRRLQQMRIQGEFDDNVDFYREELERIRRQLNNIPTIDQIENLRASATAIQDLPEIWRSADAFDRRDLVRLMLREVRVDVPNGRVVAIVPQAVFLPIFRQIPILREYDYGYFTISLPDDVAVTTGKQLPPLENSTPTKSAVAPFFLADPMTGPENMRIHPGVSHALTLFRQADSSPKSVVQIETPPHPLLPMDLRRWPNAEAVTISRHSFLAKKTGTMDVVISTHLLWQTVIAKHATMDEQIRQIVSRLRTGGVWHLIEPLPLDAPAHWLYRFFPAAWDWARAYTWTMQRLYTNLQNAGCRADCRRTVYSQQVSLKAMWEIAQSRPGQLAILDSGSYGQGIDAVKKMIEEKGENNLIASEFTLVEIWAQKIAA